MPETETKAPSPTGVQCVGDALASKHVKATSKHPYLTIKATSAPDAHTITLSGEVDLLGAPNIAAALEDISASESRLVIIDLRDLTFIDSSGLHALAHRA